MDTTWDDHETSVSDLSPRAEARLIVTLARQRAAQAWWHGSKCRCLPCQIRQHDQLRAAAIRMSKAAG